MTRVPRTAPLLVAGLIHLRGVADGLAGFGVYLAVLFLIALLAIRRLDPAGFRDWGQGG